MVTSHQGSSSGGHEYLCIDDSSGGCDGIKSHTVRNTDALLVPVLWRPGALPNSDSHNSVSQATVQTDGRSKTAHLDPNKEPPMI